MSCGTVCLIVGPRGALDVFNGCEITPEGTSVNHSVNPLFALDKAPNGCFLCFEPLTVFRGHITV